MVAKVTQARSPSSTPWSVFLYWPNIIGYVRVILALISCFLMPISPYSSISAYLLSCVLDAVDGFVARYFDQCTQFGAVLDMITDRSTTTCLLAYLAIVYPSWLPAFQFLMALDLSSHYMHMYSSLATGASSHKQLDDSEPRLLRLYYHNKLVLFLICAGNEVFFVGLYLLHHLPPTSHLSTLNYMVTCISLPVCILKQTLNFVQMTRASYRLAQLDSVLQPDNEKKIT